MVLFKTADKLHNYLDLKRKQGKTCGFVPTMGALHAGHISLVKACKKDNDLCVVSIFVNPTQFNDKADFEKYPLTPEQDIALLEQHGCDILFMPPASEIYPGGIIPSHHYELGELETVLEGKFRPGHFQGVCMVVDRLLQLVQPNRLYLGQKDYQQCMVITRLLALQHPSVELKIESTYTSRKRWPRHEQPEHTPLSRPAGNSAGDCRSTYNNLQKNRAR
jgi:pantoate--beta-alanine ligase